MGKNKRLVVGKVYTDKTKDVCYVYLGNVSYKKYGKVIEGHSYLRLGKVPEVGTSFNTSARAAVKRLADGNLKTNRQGSRLNYTVEIGEISDACLKHIFKSADLKQIEVTC